VGDDGRPGEASGAKLTVDHIGYRAPARQTGGAKQSGGSTAPRAILTDVSFAVRAHHVFTVLGPSGAGKSTLLRVVNRLIEPSEGRVLLDGASAMDLPVQVLRRRVGMVFQAAALFDGTVMDNVLYGPRLQGELMGQADGARERASELLHRVGLPDDFCDKPASELSGGEAQRVCLARALANGPEVLLLDEPTASLDPTAARHVEELLARLADETDLTFLFVTHDLRQARRIGDRGLLLVDGRVVEEGPLPDLLDDPDSEVTQLFVDGRLGSQSPSSSSSYGAHRHQETITGDEDEPAPDGRAGASQADRPKEED
jgi:putative ABC transport system ATP-binding protein